MRLINNRYIIDEMLRKDQIEESYLVRDLWNKEKLYHMRVLDPIKDSKIITYYLDNFSKVSQIKHKNLLSSIDFGIIETINLKWLESKLFYVISDYTNSPLLNDSNIEKRLETRLNIILDILSVIDYLHFRGITYKYLCPSHIYYSKDDGLKLLNLSRTTIIPEKIFSHDSNEEYFAPEVLMNSSEIENKTDYYSIGMIMKYLLLKDYTPDVYGNYVYKEELKLCSDERLFLTNIINNLTKTLPIDRNLSLRTIIDEVISTFKLDYKYDLVKERDKLFFNAQRVGLDREINELLLIDENIEKKSNYYKGVVIRGSYGLGKTRLIKELSFRLKMKNRTIYNVSDGQSLYSHNISTLIKKITSIASPDLVEKYKDDFTRLLTELNENYLTDINDNKINEKFKLFNRICNFVNEVSKGSILYIIVENIERANPAFIQFIDYLIRNSSNGRYFLLISFNEGLQSSNNVIKFIKNWTSNSIVTNIYLKPLNLEETGSYVRGLLGISYIPYRFVATIYNESKGVPAYIDLIVKELYNRRELYIHKDGYWAIKTYDISQLKIPLDLNDVIKSQLKKYSETQLEVIKALSIYNIKVNEHMLLDMINIEEEKLKCILIELINDRVVEESIGDCGYYYNIISEELRRYVYHNISKEEGILSHLKAAKTIINLYNQNYGLVLEELIYHLQRANKLELAVSIIVKEAEKLNYKDIANSILLWEKAYNISDNIPKEIKLKILDNLTNLYQLKGDDDNTEQYLFLLLEETKDLNNMEYYMKAMEYKGETLLKKNKLGDVSKIIEDLEIISNKYDLQEGKVLSNLLKARLLLRSGDLDNVLALTENALKISEEYKIDKYLGQLYNFNGIINNMKGNINYSLEQYKKSIEAFESSEFPYYVVKPINNIGNLIYESYGDFERSLEYYEQCLEISKKYNLNNLMTIFLNIIGEVYIDLLEYKKAFDNLIEARNLADKSNDLKMVFLCNLNLGYIYLNTNQLDKAYKIYTYLDMLNKTSPILDGEAFYEYNNFLGEFYYHFGRWDLAEKYSIVARNFYKDYNIKGFFKAESRIIYINYFKNDDIDREGIYQLINNYKKSNIVQENLRFILNMAKLFLIYSDLEEAKNLVEVYENLTSNINSSILNFHYKIIKLLLIGSDDSYMEAENIINSTYINDMYGEGLDYRVYLGIKYTEKKSYSKALRQFLEVLDSLYKIGRYIPEGELKNSLFNYRNPDFIKDKILYVLEVGYKKDISKININKADINNFGAYFDISDIIDSLSKDEFYDILYYQDSDCKITTTMDLLCHMSDNYLENLKLILNYLARETIAKRGMIIKIDDESGLVESLVSLNDDNNLPDQIILYNALKSEDYFLFNRSLKVANDYKVRNLIPNHLTGIICVPICSNKKYSYDKIERRRCGNIQDYKLVGYIYLETDRVLNRFDLERYSLISSLVNLVFLNIENDLLQKISTTDKVTGTYTRKYFEERFDKLLEKYTNSDNSFNLLIIDIDKFKNINDTYGHLKGDEVLSILGRTIKKSVRDTDLVGRYGGEEFLVLLNNSTTEDGLEIASKIRKNIENTHFSGIERPITVSIGISSYPNHGTQKNELISRADQALYYAKEVLGRNQHALWYSGMEMASNKIDKLTGLVTGDPIRDNRNMLTIVDVSYLVKEGKTFDEKVYVFLGKIIEIVEGESASLILYENGKLKEQFSRRRREKSWITNIHVNKNLVEKIIDSNAGECFIDWGNVSKCQDSLMDEENWQSVLILPLIKRDHIKAILYVTAPLKEKEFDFMNLNVCNVLSNIFVGSID